MTTWSTPESTHVRNWACKSIDSGVVRAPVNVPITCTDAPWAVNSDPRMDAVVVFPFVPVMPTIFKDEAG